MLGSTELVAIGLIWWCYAHPAPVPVLRYPVGHISNPWLYQSPGEVETKWVQERLEKERERIVRQARAGLAERLEWVRKNK